MIRILLVEDNNDFISAAKKFFDTQSDVEIVWTKDYDEAMAVVREDDSIQGAIIDCFFPKKTGSKNKSLAKIAIDTVKEKFFYDELDKSEHNQPLGVLVATYIDSGSGAAGKIPLVMTTSLYHHGNLVNGICMMPE